MPFPNEMNSRAITGRQTTAGAGEETLQLSLDGAAAANTVAVGAGVFLVITDWIVSAGAAANFRLQQANDGITFFDVALWRQPADGSGGVSALGMPIRVTGGATVVIRTRAETPGGAAAVTTTLRAYTTTAQVN
jgi:hypothetical protein